LKEREPLSKKADDMARSQIESVQYYDQFKKLGFKAGITLKGDWASENEVYEYIREEIVSANVQMVIPNQAHGADLLVLNSGGLPGYSEVDGTITDRTDLCLTVTTADCIPLLFADPKSGLFGAIHVGWRSFVAGILDNLFQAFVSLDVNKNDVLILIGPSIGPCCFEVGGEVAALFDEDAVNERDSHLYVDLNRAVRNKIASNGVANHNTEGILECTSCFADRYYSYRRDKESPIQLVSFVFRLT
jgi:YfiH family protein